MRYLRKETAFMLNGGIIIPECISRISVFGKEVGQLVSMTPKSGSIVITAHTNYNLPSISISGVFSMLDEGNILTISKEVLVKSGFVHKGARIDIRAAVGTNNGTDVGVDNGADVENDMRIVILYLMDANTIEVFPAGQVKDNDGGSRASEFSERGYEHGNDDVCVSHKAQSSTRSKVQNDHFVIENRHEILRIRLSDIYYFEKIKGTHNTCIVYADGLSTFKDDLRDILSQLDGGFVQCHKAFIANMTNVKRIEKSQAAYMLHFDKNHSCPCSMFYRKEVLNWEF